MGLKLSLKSMIKSYIILLAVRAFFAKNSFIDVQVAFKYFYEKRSFYKKFLKFNFQLKRKKYRL